MKTAQLLVEQVDRALKPSALTSPPAVPAGGWLRAVRNALGMSTRQLAARVGVTHPAIVHAEQAEASGAISLRQLRHLADMLGCDLHYVLQPRVPLADQIDAQAERKARERVAAVGHSMALEAQQPGMEFAERQVDIVKDELLRGRRSRLWE